MGNKGIRRIVYVLLLCLAVQELSSVASVFAAERKAREEEKQWMRDAGAGLVDWRDKYDPLKEEDVPEAVGYEEAVWSNHIERMYDEEGKDLNRVIFKNADGSRTQYLFDYPVKYVDKKGKIQNSSFEIADSKDEEYKFETAASISKTRFPKDIKDGIELSGEDVTVTLVPHDVKNTEPERVDDETISYKYDNKTTIEYSLTYTGFKEDIVVSEYTGQTEYEFTIYTEGLALAEIDGSFYLVDENEEIKATIGDIIIFTADEKNNAFGELKAETVVENEEYRMTIVLDPEYLADPETVYPIRIDPTVEITYDKNGAGAIEDVTLNSLRGSSGSSGSLSVGLRSTYGISRILMKFPGLDLSDLGTNAQITKAEVQLRDLMCEGTNLTVECRVFTGNDWTESTANWSNVSPNSYSEVIASNTMTYATGKGLSPKHRYSFDITAAVNGWLLGSCDQDKGIIFKATDALENGSTYDCRTIASYNRASNKPSLSVTYTTTGIVSNGTYYLNNKYSGNYLTYSSSKAVGKSGLLANLGAYVQWEIVKTNGGYVIRSKTDTTKYLGVESSTAGSSVVVRPISNTTIPEECTWTITIATGGACLVKNNANQSCLYTYGTHLYTSTSTGTIGTYTYNSRVWRIASTSYYGTATSCTKKELSASFSIPSMVLDIDESATPTIKKTQSNALWADASDFMYSMTSAGSIGIDNITKHAITGKTSGTYTLKATHKVTKRTKTFTVKVNKNAIIIIPGFIGSELKTTASYGTLTAGEQIWFPIEIATDLGYNAKVIEHINALKCNSSGVPNCSTVEVNWNGAEYEADKNYGTLNAYEKINTSLVDKFGDEYDVYMFQYDWRQSNKKSAEQLDDFITDHECGRVIIIAHSMGGLVAANYLNLGVEQQEKVRTYISLGVPYLGSVYITEAFLTARDLRWFLYFAMAVSDNIVIDAFEYYANSATDALYNLPAVYELFPNEQYYAVAGKSYVAKKTDDATEVKSVGDYEELKTFLSEKLYGYNSVLMDKADVVNNSLYVDGQYITSTVDSYYIVGTRVSTIKNIIFDETTSLYRCEAAYCGDGVVPSWSADLGGVYPQRTFYATCAQHVGYYSLSENSISWGGNGLVTSENVIQKIIDIINGNPYSSVSGITQNSPVYDFD